MKFAIALFSPPHSPSSRRALRFSEALLSGGHDIIRIFFYQDGVYNASANIVMSQDECDLTNEWREFIKQHRLDGVVCIAAALRRGILDEQEVQRHNRPTSTPNLSEGWSLSGLGQFHEAAQQADRLICFGGH
ncbi:sulfurtransferase complex subunit TusD [Azomonas macrocytogenes]|uniref:tRNA 2-thiouridine synthesizing protein D n=1 Tax=Azomonas macrocytogenes TaxID=69962 RepID=A0A839SX02_AZOMA|nr:sulfurtransferase complex subunit TusD [Azomonas macrocytogenes]MBB3101642.1 tRNA 2-thiouridine synthesizing protein D [Azomonas macrocytogenes]